MQKTTWRMPPRIKIIEALGAVVDERVQMVDGGAQVTSSSGGKAYRVRFDAATNAVTSNDNASYFVGYIGYPIIAFLFASGRLDYDKEIAERFAGIHWKQLNTDLGNNYARLEEEILKGFSQTETERVHNFVKRAMADLKSLQLGVLPSNERPPSAW